MAPVLLSRMRQKREAQDKSHDELDWGKHNGFPSLAPAVDTGLL
jgi:hypothetical protein